MRKVLRRSEINQFRYSEGKSILLFITEQCPVGCKHCSVDSKPDSSSIRDIKLFDQLLEGLSSRDDLYLIGISGGEPFFEKKGLVKAVDKLTDSGKQVVIYTSGFWGQLHVQEWIKKLLIKTSSVYLSIDNYHLNKLRKENLLYAVKAIVEAGSWLIIQTLEHEEHISVAREIVIESLGNSWEQYGEINTIQFLPYGRGGNAFREKNKIEGKKFGSCKLLCSQVVRFDGMVTACCNELVIQGEGPKRLRYSANNATDLNLVLNKFNSDRLNSSILKVGLKSLIKFSQFQKYENENFSSICELCWKIQDTYDNSQEQCDTLLSLINTI